MLILPDIHGDLRVLFRSLWLAARKTNWPDVLESELMDAFIHGEMMPPAAAEYRVALVQLGDVVNRGPAGKTCYATLLAVERTLGWKLFLLFGNHELMAFTGSDTQYVHEADYGLFGGRNGRSFEFSPFGNLWQHINFNSLLVARLGLGSTQLSDVPSDLDTLFVHGGIEMAWFEAHVDSAVNESIDVGDLNKQVRMVMRDPVAAHDLLSAKNSPIWTRKFTENSFSPEWCQTELPRILQVFRVSRIVVGHCPLARKRAIATCNGQVLLTDVTMSRWMSRGGQPVAIIMSIEANEEGTPVLDSIVAHYVGSDIDLEETDILWPPSDETSEDSFEGNQEYDGEIAALAEARQAESPSLHLTESAEHLPIPFAAALLEEQPQGFTRRCTRGLEILHQIGRGGHHPIGAGMC